VETNPCVGCTTRPRHAVEQSSRRFSAKASRKFLRGGARHRRELVAGQQVVELPLRLGEALLVERVHHVHDAVDGREVVLPEPPRRLVAAEVEGLEPDVADDQLVLVRVQRRLVDLHAVLLEHVQQRRLARVVQAQEEDLGGLVVQAQVRQNVKDPVEEPHGRPGSTAAPTADAWRLAFGSACRTEVRGAAAASREQAEACSDANA